MNNFDYAACNGKHFNLKGSTEQKARPRLIKKMLGDRSIPRIVFAPAGFGKTRLAYEYAEEVFNFYDTFWVEANSPDFLQKLDAGCYTKADITDSMKRGLVIFDDLPYLNERRKKTFVSIVKKLIKGSCEVIITARPTFNVDELLGDDIILVGSLDLELDVKELEDVVEGDTTYENRYQGPDLRCIVEQIPCLAWGTSEEQKTFIRELNGENIPSNVKLASFVILALQQGMYEDVSNVMKSFTQDVRVYLIRHYPFLGLDGVSETFDACRIDIDLLFMAFQNDLSGLAETGAFNNRDGFIIRLADMLSYHGDYDRASQLIMYGCVRGKRIGWIESVQDDFHAHGYVCSIERVAQSLGSPARLSPKFLLGSLFRHMTFHDWNKSNQLYKRIMSHKDSEQVHKSIAALLCLRHPVDSVRNHAVEVLLSMSTGTEESTASQKEAATSGLKKDKKAKTDNRLSRPFDAAVLYLCGIVARGEFSEFEKNVRAHMSALISDDVFMLILVVAYRLSQDEKMASLAGDVLVARAREGISVSLYELVLFNAIMMRCFGDAPPSHDGCSELPSLNAGPIGSGGQSLVSDIETYVLCCSAEAPSQLTERTMLDYVDKCYLMDRTEELTNLLYVFTLQYKAFVGADSYKRDGASVSVFQWGIQPSGASQWLNPLTSKPLSFSSFVDEGRYQKTLAKSQVLESRHGGQRHALRNGDHVVIPHLHIRLFGGMEVTLGDKVLDPHLFTKQKAKTLLAILALNLGREVPRQVILDSMWPNLYGDAPVNNFYSMWSILRKALSTPDGSCPYLVRHQGSCMLDARYVTCDVTDVDELCHAMLFDDLDAREWVQTSAKLEEAYAGELLPSEIRNDYIGRMREIYHQRLIDALVSASHRTSLQGDAKLGLWFARVALGYEQSREDVYRVLMEAQALSGQRTEAVETFMTCLRRMRDDYGVDLSPEMMQLYEGLVLNREQVSITE